jgi:hypothetical protein
MRRKIKFLNKIGKGWKERAKIKNKERREARN